MSFQIGTSDKGATMDAILVPWRRVDTIFDELDAVERQVPIREKARPVEIREG